MEQTIIPIPFNKLVPTSRNMRKVPSSKFTDQQLKASIKAHNGILQNLIVSKVEGMEAFEVGAGGRRCKLFGELVEEGLFSSDEEIWCRVVASEDLEEMSLAENWGREGVHPADLFMSLSDQVRKGATVEDMVAATGMPCKDVRRLLRLSRVSKKLIKLFRSGQISYDEMQAFATVEDQKKQLACYEALQGRLNSYQIRQYLTDTYLSSSDREVRYVTLAAYKKAGGEVSADLLETTTYVTNPGLIDELYQAKLQRYQAKQGKGWKWCQIVDSYHAATELGRVLPADYVGVPEALLAKIAQVEQEIFQHDQNYTDWEDEDHEKEEELNGILRDLQQQREEYRAYTDAQKAVAGCAVYVDRNGKPCTLSAILLKKDQKALKAKEAGKPDSVLSSIQGERESNALQVDLRAAYQHAFQVHMLDHDDLAMDLMVYLLAVSASKKGQYYGVSHIVTSVEAFGESITEESDAEAKLMQVQESLKLDFLNAETQAEQFEAFRALSVKEKQRVAGYFVARSLGNPMGTSNKGLLAWLVDKTSFDLSRYWQPNQGNYFKRITTPSLLSIGGEMKGEEWVAENSTKKKGILVDLLSGYAVEHKWMPAFFKSK